MTHQQTIIIIVAIIIFIILIILLGTFLGRSPNIEGLSSGGYSVISGLGFNNPVVYCDNRRSLYEGDAENCYFPGKVVF